MKMERKDIEISSPLLIRKFSDLTEDNQRIIDNMSETTLKK